MWMMKTENKGKRILAALLALCMSLQLFGWNLGSFQAFAGESGEKPLQKTISVSEKEILKALETELEDSAEIDEKILPYIGSQNEMAKDHLESLLSQAVIVKQKSLGSKCAAIVAVEADDEFEEDTLLDDEDVESQDEEKLDEGIDYDRILMIGINGNEKRDCEFTLEITNAEGIVVKELKVTGYRQDRELATDSNAAATASNAKMTDSNAAEIVRDDENVKDPTDSDAEEDDDRTYLFVEDYNEVYDEETASRLLTVKKQNEGITLLSLFSADEEENGQEEIEEEVEQKKTEQTEDLQKDEVPKMMVRAGGFGMAALLKESVKDDVASNLARVSLSASSDIWDEVSEKVNVKSGETFTINATATYSAVSSSNIKKAFYTVEFKIDDSVKELVIGPESEKNAQPVESLTGKWAEEWEQIRLLLNSSRNDWQLISVESFNFFYSEEDMIAVFSLQGESGQGSSISGIPFRFRFLNGLTPDGTTMRAVPGVLNQKELEEDYSEHNNGASAEGQIVTGSDLNVECNAKFVWNDVNKERQGNLEDLYGKADTNQAIQYTISTSPNYGSDKNIGIMYTRAYTVTDKMYFENFYIDSTGCEVYYPDSKRPGEFSLKNITSGLTKKLIGLDLPKSAMENGVAKPIYENGNEDKIIGIEIQYTVVNDTLDGDTPSDLSVKSMDCESGRTDRHEGEIKIWFHYGNFRGTDLLKFEGDGLPKVTNDVYFDAYSIMYDKTDYPGLESPENSADNRIFHHSHAQVAANAEEFYSITKKAYRESTCVTEAVGENQVFGPENQVFYQITVENKGYNHASFRVEDQIPDGLKQDRVSLLSLKVGNPGVKDGMTEVTPIPDTVKKENGAVLSWDGIQIPAGQSAVLVLEGTIKSREDILKESTDGNKPSSYRLDNTARFYFSGTETKKGEATATVFAKLDELKAGEVEFTKARDGSGKLSIGSDVTYILTAKLKDATVAPQRLMITDHWPEQLTLKQISQIPAEAIVTLKNGEEIIASYTNKGSKNSTANIPGSFKTPQNATMQDEDIARIRDVEIDVFVDGQTEKKIKLTGSVTAGGEIVNNADTSAGNKPAPVTIAALAMKIEKNAYHIAASDKDKITEENSLTNPVNEKITFAADDVICYEVAVTNTGTKGQLSIEPVITDNYSNLFNLDEAPKPATATLNGKKGSVFIRRESEAAKGVWEPVEVADGKLTLKLEGNALQPTETERIRIYVSVPEQAVGASPEKYINTATATIKIGETEYPVVASATVTTLKNGEQHASIQKEVIAVARNLTDNNGIKLVNAKWKDKELFGEGTGYEAGTDVFTVGAGDYVFYRMKVHNDSETDIKIYEIQDWLPDGMTFSRFYTFNPQQGRDKKNGKWGAVNGTDTLNLGNAAWGPKFGTNNQNWLFYDDAAGNDQGIDYGSGVKHTTKHMNITGTTYRARTYGDKTISDNSNELATIKSGKTMVFGIIAQVTGNGLKSGDILTNTAGFITDHTVSKENGVKNCDDSKSISELCGMTISVGGKTYLTDEYKAFTSSADVIYSGYTPGIEKELSQFNVTGQWNDYDPNAVNQNFAPTDWMRWSVKLSNGMYGHATAGAIEEYTVSDTLPLGLDYNSGDGEGNYFKTAKGDKVLLPEPRKTTVDGGKTRVSWNVRRTESGYEIVGDENAYNATKNNLSIPAHGSIDLQISTKKAEDASPLRYGTYLNRADLVPEKRYTYTNSCAGKIEGEMPDRTIYATAQVNIFGSGRTESWKEISGTYNGISVSASGRNSDNYILSDAGGTVTYSLHVQNPSAGALSNLVIMDHLPAIDDNGLVNNSKRYSDFAVKFAETMNLQVSIGNDQLESNQYAVFYGTWDDLAGEGSALSDAQWKIDNREHWQTDHAEEADSIRIEITDKDALNKMTNQKDDKSNESLTVTFNAVVPEANELKDLDTAIAWNTFGYSYEIDGQAGDGTFLTVEPAKVGVKIPTAELFVKKEVESRVAGDDTKQFTFVLEKKENGSIRNLFADQWVPAEGQKYMIGDQICHTGPDSQTSTEAGQTLGAGEFLLADGQQAVFTVIANSEYRVKELDADGFVVKVTQFTTDAKGEFSEYNGQNPPTIKAVAGEKYFCTFKNIKSSLVLPETGGMGTGRFHMAGIFTMMLAALLAVGYWMISYSKLLKKEKDGNGYEKEI